MDSRGGAETRIRRSLVLLAWVLGCSAARTEPLPTFERSQIVAHAETLALRVDGDSLGVMVLQLEVGRDSVRGAITPYYHDSMAQHVLMTFDPRSLRPVRVRDSSSLEVVDLRYSANRVSGTRIVWNPAGAQDTLNLDVPIDSATLDRRSLLTVASWLPLAPGRVFGASIFDSWSRRVVPVRIAVGHESRITVPSGTFRAYRLDVTTLWATGPNHFGLFPTVLYVSVDSPRVLLRIERPRQHAICELISRRSL